MTIWLVEIIERRCTSLSFRPISWPVIVRWFALWMSDTEAYKNIRFTVHGEPEIEPARSMAIQSLRALPPGTQPDWMVQIDTDVVCEIKVDELMDILELTKPQVTISLTRRDCQRAV